MKSILFLLTIAFSATLNIRSQVRVGDPDVVPDPSKYDVDYPQMERWAKTGVEIFTFQTSDFS